MGQEPFCGISQGTHQEAVMSREVRWPEFELWFLSLLTEWPCHNEQEGWLHQGDHSVGRGSGITRGQDGYIRQNDPNPFCFKWLWVLSTYVCWLFIQAVLASKLYHFASLLHSVIQQQHIPKCSEEYPKIEEKREMNSSAMLKIISIIKIPCNRKKQWGHIFGIVMGFLITMK